MSQHPQVLGYVPFPEVNTKRHGQSKRPTRSTRMVRQRNTCHSALQSSWTQRFECGSNSHTLIEHQSQDQSCNGAGTGRRSWCHLSRSTTGLVVVLYVYTYTLRLSPLQYPFRTPSASSSQGCESVTFCSAKCRILRCLVTVPSVSTARMLLRRIGSDEFIVDVPI